MLKSGISPQAPGSLGRRIAPWAVLAAIVAGYFGLVWSAAQNLPYADDYAILDFVGQGVRRGFSWPALWAVHNEHRIVFTRLVALAFGWVGQVNFKGMILVGNLGWLGCGILLGMQAVRRSGTVWAAVPVAMLLAEPAHHENMLWGMAALQNYWVLLAVVACLQLAAAGRMVGAGSAFAAALLISGAGVAAAPSLVGFPLLRREWRKFLAMAGVAGLLMLLYFVGFESASHLHATSWTSAPLYFANFLGGAVPDEMVAPWIGGALAAALVGIAVRSGRDSFPGGLAVFLLVTAAVAAVARGGQGTEQALASRYAIFSQLGFVCVWLALLPVMRPPWRAQVGRVVVALAVVMSVMIFLSGRWIRQREAILMEYYKVVTYPSHSTLRDFMNRAHRDGIYEELPVENIRGVLEPWLVSPASEGAGATVRGYVDEFDGRFILGWAHVVGRNSRVQQPWFRVTSDQGAWEIPAIRFERPDLQEVYRDADYRQSGVQAMLPLFDLPAGKYEISLVVRNRGVTGVLATGRTYEATGTDR